MICTAIPRLKEPHLHSLSDLAVIAARAADDKKGTETIILDVGETFTITDYFVVTSAPNSRLVRTIAESIEEEVKAAGGPAPVSIEGLDHANWVLVDFGGFCVHVFLEETRRFYDLERLWADAARVAWALDAIPAKSSKKKTKGSSA